MKKISSIFFTLWRPSLIVLSLAAIAYLLYFHNIIHLLPGYDTHELEVYRKASNWHSIVHNPLNAPYDSIVWIGAVLGHHSIAQARLAAGCLGIIAGLLFYTIVYRWFGFGIAFLATIMFTTSAGFLHVARLGSPQILQMAILLFIAAILSYPRMLKKNASLTGYLFTALLAILLYIPGMIWVEIFGLVLIRSALTKQWRDAGPAHRALWFVLFAGLVAPLVAAAIHTPRLLQLDTGLPATLHTLTEAPINVGKTLLGIGIHSTGNPEFFVGHAPLLNIVEVILAAMGLIYYLRRFRTPKALFLVGASILALILTSLGGMAGLALLLPLLYIFVATGLDELTGQWLGVFPRNPLARSVGIGLIVVMLSFSVLYQIRSYFVAWPHNVMTEHTFSHPQP